MEKMTEPKVYKTLSYIICDMNFDQEQALETLDHMRSKHIQQYGYDDSEWWERRRDTVKKVHESKQFAKNFLLYY